MSLEKYILDHTSIQESLTYEWSDAKCRTYYMFEMPKDYLCEISDAASLALLLGTMSWIHRRFNPIEPDLTPGFIHDAGWAYMIEPEACVYWEFNDDLWRGSKRAPLSVMMTILMDALFCRGEDPEVRVRTYWMANLARHVLEKDVPAFDHWFKLITKKLIQIHPRDEMPKLGLFDVPVRFEPVVGLSALVPDGNYDPNLAKQEILNYLLQGKNKNPYIHYEELNP